MRAIILIPRYFPDQHAQGPNNGARSVYQNLVSLGVKTEIWTHKTKKATTKNSIRRFRPNLLFKLNKRFLFSLGCLLQLLFASRKINIYYSRAWYDISSSLYISILILLNRRVVVSSSGRFSRYNFERLNYKIRWHKRIFPLLYKDNKIEIHFSSREEYLNAMIPFKPKFVWMIQTFHGQYLGRTTFPSEDDRLLIFSVSRVSKEKNIGQIFEQLSSIQRSVTYMHFGAKTTAESNRLRLMAKKHDITIQADLQENELNEKVFIDQGYRTKDEIYKMVEKYKNRVFIQLGSSEGTSNSVIEAMRMGNPCCLSNGCNMLFDEDRLISSNLEQLVDKIYALSSQEIDKRVKDYYALNFSKKRIENGYVEMCQGVNFK